MAVAKVSVRIPMKLKSEANHGGHWMSQSRRAKDQREVTCMVVRPALRMQMRAIDIERAAHIAVQLVRRSPRQLDGDNLQRAFKACRDGVADALGIDDGDHRIAWLYDQIKDAEHGIDVVVEVE